MVSLFEQFLGHGYTNEKLLSDDPILKTLPCKKSVKRISVHTVNLIYNYNLAKMC